MKEKYRENVFSEIVAIHFTATHETHLESREDWNLSEDDSLKEFRQWERLLARNNAGGDNSVAKRVGWDLK